MIDTQLHNSMNGQTALVTGAGQGMGKAIALALSACGANVVVADVNYQAAADVVGELTAQNKPALAVGVDVTSKSQVQEMVAKAVKEFGSLHILVNNAGVLRPSRVSDIEEQEWDFVVGINLKGTFLCSQAALPYMQQAQWGRIVNLSSTAGKSVSTIGGAHYTAAKAGVLGFTRHLSREVAAEGITVNAVCPGLIDTEMVRATIPAEKIQAYEQTFPISRLGKCEEVANLVTFLCSNAAAYITGASLDINGGDLTI